jgi:hypothetical protein
MGFADPTDLKRPAAPRTAWRIAARIEQPHGEQGLPRHTDEDPSDFGFGASSPRALSSSPDTHCPLPRTTAVEGASAVSVVVAGGSLMPSGNASR